MDPTCLGICNLIPHRGAMCLLESVEEWDEGHIVCRTTSHLRLDNPLRDGSGLRALCGIEYGAQAMAVHAALLQGLSGPNCLSGVLVSARDVMTTRSHLDDLPAPLVIRATLLSTHDQGSIYEIIMTGDGRTVMTGRLSVMVSIHHPHLAPAVSTEGDA